MSRKKKRISRKNLLVAGGGAFGGGNTGDLRFYDLKSGKHVEDVTMGFTSRNVYSSVQLDRHTLLVGGDQDVRAFNLRRMEKMKKKKGGGDLIFKAWQSYSFSFDRINTKIFCTGGSGGFVKVWSINKPDKALQEFTSTGQNYCVKTLQSVRDTIASCGSSNVIELWNLRKKKKVHTIQPNLGNMWALSEIPRHRLIVALGYGTYQVKLYDARKPKKEIRTSMRVDHSIWNGVAIPRSNELWIGTNSGSLYIFDYRKMNKERKTWKPHTSCLYKCTYVPEAKSVLTASMDRNVKLIRVKDQKEMKSITTGCYNYTARYLGAHTPFYGSSMYFSRSFEDDDYEFKDLQRLKKHKSRVERIHKQFEAVQELAKKSEDDVKKSIVTLKPLRKNIDITKSSTTKKDVESGQQKKDEENLIRIHRSLLMHSRVLREDPLLKNQATGNAVNIVPVDEKLILKMLLAPKPISLVKMLWETELGSLDESMLMKYDQLGEVDDDDDGKFEDMFYQKFSIEEQKQFVDLYVLFRYLNLPHEMLYILKCLTQITRPEILLVLFIKCLYYFERPRIQALFLPPEDIARDPSQTLSFPPEFLAGLDQTTDGPSQEVEGLDEEDRLSRNWDIGWIDDLEKRVLDRQTKEYVKTEKLRQYKQLLKEKIEMKRKIKLEELRTERRKEIDLEKMKKKQLELERKKRNDSMNISKAASSLGFFFGFGGKKKPKEEEEEEEESEGEKKKKKKVTGSLDEDDFEADEDDEESEENQLSDETLLEELGEIELDEKEEEELEEMKQKIEEEAKMEEELRDETQDDGDGESREIDGERVMEVDQYGFYVNKPKKKKTGTTTTSEKSQFRFGFGGTPANTTTTTSGFGFGTTTSSTASSTTGAAGLFDDADDADLGVSFGNVGFESSISMFLFNEMKRRVGDIRDKTDTLKYFVTLMQSLESHDEENVGKHVDLLPLKNTYVLSLLHEKKSFDRDAKEDLKLMPSPEEFQLRQEIQSKNVRFDRVSETFRNSKLSNDSSFTNCVVKSKDSSEEGFKVHKEYLILRSPFFYRQFCQLAKKDKKKEEEEEVEGEDDDDDDVVEKEEEKEEEIFVLSLPDGRIPRISDDELEVLIHYYYTRSFLQKKTDTDVLFKLISIAIHSDDHNLLGDVFFILRKIFSFKTESQIIRCILSGLEKTKFFENVQTTPDETRKKLSEKRRREVMKEKQKEEVDDDDDSDDELDDGFGDEDLMLNILVSQLSGLEVRKGKNSSEMIEERDFMILLEKTIQKFRIDKIISNLKDENRILAKRNKELEQEVIELGK